MNFLSSLLSTKHLALSTIFSCLLTIFCSAGWGQGFTPVPYNFPNNFESNTGYYTDYKDNSGHSFSIVSSASNGYGTWVATSDGRWLLLGNMLNTENTTASIPSGIIQSGTIPFTPGANISRVKVVANLNGSVRFVWTSGNGGAFYIAGFDASDIDITMRPGYPHATGTKDIVTATAMPLQSGPITLRDQVNANKLLMANDGGPSDRSGSNYKVNNKNQDDWRDVWDIAMDNGYLYFAFCYFQNRVNDVFVDYDVYTFAVDLQSNLPPPSELVNGNTALCWQVNSASIANGNFNQSLSNEARRPTVSCNKRNNGPLWDVCYLTYNEDVTNVFQAVGSQPFYEFLYVAKMKYDASALSYTGIPAFQQNQIYFQGLSAYGCPNQKYPVYNSAATANTGFCIFTYGRLSHARIVDGSVTQGSASSPPVTTKVIYAIFDPTGSLANFKNESVGNLVCYRLTTVDGAKDKANNYNLPAPYPNISPLLENTFVAFPIDGGGFEGTHDENLISPIPNLYTPPGMPETNVPFGVIDEPITAFSNPYDGESQSPNSYYDEFHCIYRMIDNQQAEDPNDVLLMTVQGCNTGTNPKINDNNKAHALADTRTLLNRTFDGSAWYLTPSPPDNTLVNGSAYFVPPYFASANQMGLHFYWSEGGNIWNYKRDLRKFDENIEENTLVTGNCIVDDGTSHRGTDVAMLQGGKIMTLWTDPNFNGGSLFAQTAGSQNYWFNADLQFGFVSDNTVLQIGTNSTSGTSQTANAAKLYLPPNFEIEFSGSDPSSNAINIMPLSTLEYYGIPYKGDDPPPDRIFPLHNFYHSGTLNLFGVSGSHAKMNIHAGTELEIPNDMTLNASFADINFPYESSILPLPNNTYPNTCGFIDLYGTGSFTSSVIQNPSTAIVPTGQALRGIVCKPLILPQAYIPNYYDGFDYTQLKLTDCTVTHLTIACNANVANNAGTVVVSNSILHPTTLDGNQRIFSVSGGSFTSGASLFIANPWNAPYEDPYFVGGRNTVSITTAAFNSSTIYLFRDNTTDYHNILVDQNTFSSGTCRVEGFGEPLEWTYGTDDPNIRISVNRINVTTNGFSSGAIGINSINSNIAAANNTLNNVGTGIVQTSTDALNPLQTTSFFCSNNISGGTIGMQLDNWQDYIKLSTIGPDPNNSNSTGPNIGIKIMDNVAGFLDWTSIKKCNFQGLFLSPSSGVNAFLTAVPNNTFELNNISATADHSGQIEIAEGGFLRIRNHSNIIRRTGSPDPKGDHFIYNSGSLIAIGFNQNQGDDIVDLNYWADDGIATPPYRPYTPHSTTHTIVNNVDVPDGNLDPHITFLTYSDGSLETGHDPALYTFSNVFCGSGIPVSIKSKGNQQLQSISEDSSLTSCVSFLNKADSLNEVKQYQNAYDEYRSYIESCAHQHNAYFTFDFTGSTNADRNGDLHRYEEYREWLKTVLYYNLDSNYYCADVNQILQTLHWFNDQRGNDFRGAIAIAKFLVATNRCPKRTAYYDTLAIPATWDALYQQWWDTVKDSIKTPFDSTLPTLEDLDLGILRGPPADVKKYFDTKYGPIISNIIALENPFSSETKIDFILRETAAIKMEIFDVLGKRYYSTEKVYDQGENQIILSGDDLPHGELFARFAASDGTVETIKLRHE